MRKNGLWFYFTGFGTRFGTPASIVLLLELAAISDYPALEAHHQKSLVMENRSNPPTRYRETL